MEPFFAHDLNKCARIIDKEKTENLVYFGRVLHEIIQNAESKRIDKMPSSQEQMFLLFCGHKMTSEQIGDWKLEEGKSVFLLGFTSATESINIAL